MVVYDRTVGGVLLLLNTVFIVYYVLWILVTPFVDASHFTQQWFPLREYGIALATLVMAVGFSLNATLASYHVLRRTGFDVRQLEGEEQRERAKRANYAAAM